jgi:hypothetical protein
MNNSSMSLKNGLPSAIYYTFVCDFYLMFEFKIKFAHYDFMKETYGFNDDIIFSSWEMNRLFIPE